MHSIVACESRSNQEIPITRIKESRVKLACQDITASWLCFRDLTFLFALARSIRLGFGEWFSCDFSASCLTSSENLSAPLAIDARARLVVLAATVPKAAASFSPEAKAASARSSAVLMDSLEGEIFSVVTESFLDFVRVFGATFRIFLRANGWSRSSLVFDFYLRCPDSGTGPLW